MSFSSSFPAELLLYVFEYLHADYKQDMAFCIRRDAEQSHEMMCSVVDQLKRQLPFPYIQAAVCKQWRNTLKISSHFWTDVVLYTTEFHAVWARQILQSSKNLPIRIFITYHYRSIPKTAKNEGDTISRLLEICRPHMRRCTWMHVETLLHTSVPSLAHDFQGGETSALTSLSFGAGLFTDDPVVYRKAGLMPPLPVLTNLTIDGFSFLQATRQPSVWEHWGRNLEVLNIYRFKKTLSTGVLLLPNIFVHIGTLPKLRNLGLRQLQHDFDEDTDLDDLQGLNITSDELKLEQWIVEGLTESAMEWMFDTFSTPHLQFLDVRACKWPLGTRLPETPFLSLGRYDPDQAPLDASWEGCAIMISHSSMVDDEFLDQLGEPQVANGGLYGCPNLNTLAIVDCSGITVEGLKKLVEKRGRHVDYSDPRWSDPETFEQPVLLNLVVTAHDYVDPPTEEERRWFQDHLRMFVWKSGTTVIDELMEVGIGWP